MEQPKTNLTSVIYLPSESPYTVLGVTPDATDEQIKKAYFGLVRANPPERAPEKFKQIRAAYESLKSPDQRLEIDMRQLQAWSAPPLSPAPELDLNIRNDDLVALLRTGSDLDVPKLHKHFREVKF